MTGQPKIVTDSRLLAKKTLVKAKRVVERVASKRRKKSFLTPISAKFARKCKSAVSLSS